MFITPTRSDCYYFFLREEQQWTMLIKIVFSTSTSNELIMFREIIANSSGRDSLHQETNLKTFQELTGEYEFTGVVVRPPGHGWTLLRVANRSKSTAASDCSRCWEIASDQGVWTPGPAEGNDGSLPEQKKREELTKWTGIERLHCACAIINPS